MIDCDCSAQESKSFNAYDTETISNGDARMRTAYKDKRRGRERNG